MRKKIALTPLIAALALAAAGCGGSDEPAATTTAKKPAAADPSRAVVGIEGVYEDKKTAATGVVFDATQGLLLTGNHAIEDAPNINVRLHDGRVTHARPLARAQCHDMAVLQLFPRPAGLSAMALADSGDANVGQPISTLTYLLETESGKPALTRVQGTISAVGVREAFPPLPATGPFIAHQTPLLAPASGSPILDAKGRMIGLNTLVAHPREPDVPGIEYALTSSYIRKRLRELKPGVGGALGGWGAEHDACHAALRNLVGLGHTHGAGAAKTTKGAATTTTPAASPGTDTTGGSGDGSGTGHGSGGRSGGSNGGSGT